MEFIMGDFFLAGGIGIIYHTTWGGILAHVIFFAMIILSIIGLFSIVKWMFRKKRIKETPGQKWLKTGKMD